MRTLVPKYCAQQERGVLSGDEYFCIFWNSIILEFHTCVYMYICDIIDDY